MKIVEWKMNWGELEVAERKKENSRDTIRPIFLYSNLSNDPFHILSVSKKN